MFASRRRHTRLVSDGSTDVCSSDLSFFVDFLVGLRTNSLHTTNLALCCRINVWWGILLFFFFFFFFCCCFFCTSTAKFSLRPAPLFFGAGPCCQILGGTHVSSFRNFRLGRRSQGLHHQWGKTNETTTYHISYRCRPRHCARSSAGHDTAYGRHNHPPGYG